ncbi:MAG: hypothetical protein ACRDLF_16185, partial [Solirubrobacteraceae bacterium]
MQRSRDALLSEERSIESERRLREEIERQVQDQMRQLTELRSRLRAQQLTLPTGDGVSLLRALVRPVGEAAKLAGERFAEGRGLPGDDRLLTFAATVMRTEQALRSLQPVAEPLAALVAEPPAEEPVVQVPAETELAPPVVPERDAPPRAEAEQAAG